jgi:hypothetical protein
MVNIIIKITKDKDNIFIIIKMAKYNGKCYYKTKYHIENGIVFLL